MVAANNYRKGFSNSELSIATESFIRQELERKRVTKREWENKGWDNAVRTLSGEILALENTLSFMVRNRR